MSAAAASARQGSRWLSRQHALLAGGFLLGLAIRLLVLPYKGTQDMDTYLDWGHRTLDLGLPNAYSGIYFPVAFQIFATTVRIADVTGLSEISAIKLVNLCCDVGAFALLLALLHRWRAPPAYALLYWLHPFFLAIFWLGYMDAQMAFLLLASLAVIAYARGWAAELAAGVPLALLMLLKPQGALIVGAIVALTAIALVRRRSAVAPLASLARLLAAPALLFVAYSWWIGTSELHSPLYLADTIRQTRTVAPSLSANMANVWALVAELYRAPGAPSYSVFKPSVYHQIATLVTVVLIVWSIAWLVPRIGWRPFAQRLVFAIAATMAIYPMTATAAHENHLFAGALALVLVAALLRDRAVTGWLSALLLVQFANLALLYGLGANDLTGRHLWWLIHAYHPGVRNAVAALSVVLWLGLAVVLARAVRRRVPA